MNTILYPCDGAVLPLAPGTDTLPRSLRVLTDACPGSLVNGIAVDETGAARVPVSGASPCLTLTSADGTALDTSDLWFCPSLNHTYRFTVDDNIQFLEDLTKNQNRYTSLFDNAYLAGYRTLHERFGLKMTLNLFYSYTPDSFTLADMTERYREEFLQNADWLRFTFHARHNDPPDPYKGKTGAHILRDFDEVIAQIVRFTGRKCISDFMTVHYLVCTREATLALQSRGIRGLMGFPDVRDGGLVFAAHLAGEQAERMEKLSLWRDPATGLTFIRNDMVINTVPLSDIVPRLKAVETGDNATGYFDVMIHEQYYYPDYEAYQHDFFEKLHTVFSWMEKKGYRSIFLDDVL